MTLAVLFLIAASWAMSPQSSPATAPAQSGAETGTSAPEQQAQPPSNAPTVTPSEAKPQTPQQPARAKHPHRKKKPVAVNCDSATPASSVASNSNTGGSGSNPAKDPASASDGAAPAPKNCPPTKIIVRHGGTSEPSIQLAPSTDQAAKQRNIINQLLGATDANLKQIAGKQLSATQQSTVGQIRDYEQQSRGAISDGDLERARTLAWKAELLSEDLIKPQK